MKRLLIVVALFGIIVPIKAQTILSLDSCRAMALRNNKQLNATRLKQEAATNIRKATRTKYLPKVDALGGYEYFSKEVSILNNDQKSSLTNLGTNAMGNIGTNIGGALTGLAQNGLISPQTAHDLGTLLNQLGTPLAQAGNELGQSIADAFRTDTHNIWSGAVMVRQPIFMGGAITAANKMAGIAEEMARTEMEGKVQSTLYTIDETYWLVVSLKQKRHLAESFRNLVGKLNDDVHALIREGVATKADGLKVDVKVNEADMALTQVDNGLSLAKMLLCQQCGLPIDTDIILADEDSETLNIIEEAATYENVSAQENRSELKLLQNAIDMSQQATNLVRAAYLPQVALTGGYMISNPNAFNGFQNKFSGVWNVGVVVRVPVWNWFEGEYKVRASKTATAIAKLEMEDANEKVDLQVAQCRYKLNEAQKRLVTSRKNVANAEENLRCANVGFREGVMESTDVIAAQTAWQAAKAQSIDAEIDVKLTQVNLRKALGILK